MKNTHVVWVRRSAGRTLIGICLLAASLIQGSARANVIGAGAQNFNPTPDGLDFVTVQSAKVLNPGIFNIGLFLNNAWNTLPYLDSSTQSRVKLDDTILGSDVNIGVGLFHNFEMGLSAPAVLNQSVQDTGDVHGQFSSTGGTEYRVNAKYRLFGAEDWGTALIGTINFNRVDNDPYVGIGAGPTYNLEAAYDHSFGPYVFGVNVGRRFRNPGTPVPNALIEPLRDQWIASLAMSRLISEIDTKLIAEIFGAAPAQSANANATRNQTSAELLVGVKHDFSTQLAFHAGAGTALIRGVSSPDWRVYVGINYAFGPVWNRQSQVEKVEPAPKPEPTAPAPEIDSRLKTVEGDAGQNVEEFRVGNILFEFDSDELAGDHEQILAPLVDHLKSVNFKKITIEGHTDSVGKSAYNLFLSKRRAESVRKYLISTGLPGSKIVAIGYGATRPIASNDNYQGRQANRRVEFKIEH